MNELLVAILIVVISAMATMLILGILKLDKKVCELDKELSKIKEIKFETLRKVVALLNKFNEKVRLNKVKQIIDTTLLAASAVQLFMLYKKIYKKFKKVA